VFFESGFEAANLDEVARGAGLAKGTIYRYFDSKAELYVEVLVRNADAFVARMQHTIDPKLAPAEQIRRIGSFYVRHYSENPEYFQIFWALENQRLIGGLPDALVQAVTDLWKSCLELVAEQIRSGIAEGSLRPCDAWETANILWILANGVIRTEADPKLRELRGRELPRVFEDAVDLMLAGLAADRAGGAGPGPTDEGTS